MGTGVKCIDGYFPELRCVVLDPVHGTVTHLVAEPKGRLGLARLVPMDLVEAAGDQIALRCGEAEFKNLAPAEETLAEFVPGDDAPVQLLPSGWRGAGGPTVEGGTIPRIPQTETVGLIPPGEVEEGRGDRVKAADGDIGRVYALRIDPGTRHVTHVLVKDGHRPGRRAVAIPFENVTGLDGGVRLSLTRQQVRDLRLGNE